MTNKDLKMWRRALNLPKLRWGQNDMAPLIELLPANAAVAEIGAFAGECTAQFLRAPRVTAMLVVDTWAGGYDPTGNDVASAADMEAALFAFKQRLWGVPGGAARANVFRGTSLAAAAELAGLPSPPRFDLVYLDADHSYEAVCADLRAWYPFVKPGGYLGGHDYGPYWPGVAEAVKDELGVDKPELFPDSSWVVQIDP